MKTYKVKNGWEGLKKIIRLTLFILLIHIPFNSWPLSGKPPYIGFEFENRQYLLDPYSEPPSDFIDDLEEYLDILQNEPLPDTKGLDKIDYFHNQWHPTPDWRWSKLKRAGGYFPKISDYLKDYYQPTNTLEPYFPFLFFMKEKLKPM